VLVVQVRENLHVVTTYVVGLGGVHLEKGGHSHATTSAALTAVNTIRLLVLKRHGAGRGLLQVVASIPCGARLTVLIDAEPPVIKVRDVQRQGPKVDGDGSHIPPTEGKERHQVLQGPCGILLPHSRDKGILRFECPTTTVVLSEQPG
jgi:hypothetical protein